MQIKRREFLARAIAGGTLSSLSGCFLFAEPDRLQVAALGGGFPSKLLDQFKQQHLKSADFKSYKNYGELWEVIRAGKYLPDLVGLGDSWLDRAIAANLIRSWSISTVAQTFPQWQQLAPVFQATVTRGDRVWGIPYRWGTTVIAYRQDKIAQPLTKWQDLWRPDLQGKIILPQNRREVIGIILKKLGYSYQTPDLAGVADLGKNLQTLHRQVKTYSNDHYLQPLLTGNCWVSVGWTMDLVRTQQLYPDLKIVIAAEGSAIWTDIWMVTKKNKNLTLAQAWQNFFLQPAIATQVTALTNTPATIATPQDLPQSVQQDQLKFLDPALFAKCEALLPLPLKTANQYDQIWQGLS
ncbi:MAG: extracellular solute-binding protein [Pseudanabaenaceae cyanobacterium bins.68]|nr:extracellular solute-binding protein [Pseudanabaenaceae cyanobacterium bins.68]